jgi:excisionase family DNA binding protein
MPAPAYKPEDFCSTEEAARALGVSLRTVRLWVESGALQAWKTPGGRRRLPLPSLQKLIADRDQVSRPDAPVAQATSTMPQLMVVDDDADMLKLYELNVLDWNLPMTLVSAKDGFEALLKIGECKPALLITDLNMPGMDGFRMVRTLRALDDYRTMPIIAVTALDRSSVAALGLPADIPVFSKPVDFAGLHKAVDARLQER